MQHDTFELRSATPGDAAAVTTLLQTSYGTLLPAAYDDAALCRALPLMTVANPDLLRSGTFYLVERATLEGIEAAPLLGCGGWTLEPPPRSPPTPGVAHLRHFATHPESTGKGVGRAIFERCVAEVRARGIQRLACLSTLNAEAFYRRLGFERIEILEFSLREGVLLGAVSMGRDI